MPMDGLTLGALARELNRVLEGGRVDRVQQPERDELLLTLRAQGGNHRLLLSSSPNNARVHLTRGAKRSPDTPPMFCMLLRKFWSTRASSARSSSAQTACSPSALRGWTSSAI